MHKEVYTQIEQSIDTLSAYGTSDAVSELSLIRQYIEAAINDADLDTADRSSRTSQTDTQLRSKTRTTARLQLPAE